VGKPGASKEVGITSRRAHNGLWSGNGPWFGSHPQSGGSNGLRRGSESWKSSPRYLYFSEIRLYRNSGSEIRGGTVA